MAKGNSIDAFSLVVALSVSWALAIVLVVPCFSGLTFSAEFRIFGGCP